MQTRGERLRAGLFLVLLLALMSGLIARLYVLQIRDHADLKSLAKRQHQRGKDVKSKRGDIYLREQLKGGHSERRVIVAGSVARHSLMVYGKQRNPEQLVACLTETLRLSSEDQQQLWQRLSKRRAFWFKRRRVTHSQAAALRKAKRTLVKVKVPGSKRPRYLPKLEGVDICEEPMRLYPFGSLAGHVLGLVDVDNNGVSGIERVFHEQLKGLNGYREFELDNRRRQIASAHSVKVPAMPGYSVVLTLDRRIQYYAERALDKACKHWTPEAASVVVLDPHSGRILALASRPHFNPERPGDTPVAHLRNRVLTDPYEPGSTIKPLLVSRVWQLGRGHPDRPVKLPRRLKVKGRRKPIEDSHTVRVKDRGTQERDAIVQSSNVGSYLLSRRLQPDEFRETFRAWGLGQKTGIILPGEGRGNLALTRKLNEGNWAALAQGYGLLVTPLQMALAYGAIANGGVLYSPRLVYQLLDHKGQVAHEFKAKARARVLDPKIARDWMTQVMAGVVESRYGTARRCRIKGYPMAGKTGTSKKLVKHPETGKMYYSPSRTVCSFIGFAPVDNPRLVIAVVVNDPSTKHGRTFGGNVAGPIASDVMRRSLKYLGVAPKLEDPDENQKPTRTARRPKAPKKRSRRA